jgi:hypothetical protein
MLERKKSDRLIDGHLCVYLVYFYPLTRFLPRQLCLQCAASLTSVNSVIQHTSLFWLQAMSSCVRAPCRTSELRVVRHPLVQTLALTFIKIACVVVTVRAYLSDFPDFYRMLLHLTLYAVASHKALASRILGAHRSRVVPSVPGSRSSETFSRTPMLVYVLLSTSRDIRSSIFVANLGHKSLISKFGDSYYTP